MFETGKLTFRILSKRICVFWIISCWTYCGQQQQQLYETQP